MWAKRRNKTFWAHFRFVAYIKTTYKALLQSTPIFELSQKRGSQWLIPVLGPRQKSDSFPPIFLQLFIDFCVYFPILCNM